MSSIPTSKVSNAINTPNGVIVPQLRESTLKEGDMEVRRVFRQRERVCVAIEDVFVQQCFRKAGDRFVLYGEEEINPDVLKVEGDTPAMEAILRPVLETAPPKAAEPAKKKSAVPQELQIPPAPKP